MLAARLLQPPACRLPFRSSVASPKPSLCLRKRGFHATTPRKDGLDTLLLLPHSLLQYLHVGLPWYAALPLSAFVVRGLLVTTMGSRARDNISRFVALNPLRHAMAIGIRDRMMQEGGFTNPEQASRLVRVQVRKETTALDERWNCSLRGQFVWTFAQLPLFLAMAEVIRRAAAINEGLLRMAASGLGLAAKSDETIGWTERKYASDIAENPWFEPSLANEGMLWFPDLLVPDPSGVLPFITSFVMFLNIYGQGSAGGAEVRSKAQQGVRYFFLTLSLMIGPICQNVPAALMLYWASSSASVMAWNVWLDYKYPVVKGFQPCVRPALLPPTYPNTKISSASILASASPKPSKIVSSKSTAKKIRSRR